MVLRWTSGTWASVKETEMRRFLCEIPAEEPAEPPTEEPTKEPTEAPTEEPTKEPTEAPTPEPIHCPAGGPTGVAPGLLYFTDALNHADAQLCCQERGGSLAVMTDASLNDAAEALLRANLRGAAYLGEPTDGYTNWDPKAPKKTGFKFAPLMRKTGKWAMGNKKYERSFFCSF